MRPHTEATPQDPSDESRPLLHRVFGHAEPDRDEGDQHQHQPEDTIDGRAADQAQFEDQRDAYEQDAVDAEPRDDVADREAVEQDAVDREAVDSEAVDDREALDDERRDDDTDVPHGDQEPDFDQSTDLKPGDAPAAPLTAIWSDESARDLRDRWREAQLSFLDDPQKAADDIRALVNEAVETLTASLSSHREQLDSWPEHRDTEQYRVVVQRYRSFFERLLAL